MCVFFRLITRVQHTRKSSRAAACFPPHSLPRRRPEPPPPLPPHSAARASAGCGASPAGCKTRACGSGGQGRKGTHHHVYVPQGLHVRHQLPLVPTRTLVCVREEKRVWNAYIRTNRGPHPFLCSSRWIACCACRSSSLTCIGQQSHEQQSYHQSLHIQTGMPMTHQALLVLTA